MAKAIIKKVPACFFPGKSFPGKKPGSTLKSRLKYQRLINPNMLGLIFTLVFEK
jgi:hypothetical protein